MQEGKNSASDAASSGQGFVNRSCTEDSLGCSGRRHRVNTESVTMHLFIPNKTLPRVVIRPAFDPRAAVPGPPLKTSRTTAGVTPQSSPKVSDLPKCRQQQAHSQVILLNPSTR